MLSPGRWASGEGFFTCTSLEIITALKHLCMGRNFLLGVGWLASWAAATTSSSGKPLHLVPAASSGPIWHYILGIWSGLKCLVNSLVVLLHLVFYYLCLAPKAIGHWNYFQHIFRECPCHLHSLEVDLYVFNWSTISQTGHLELGAFFIEWLISCIAMVLALWGSCNITPVSNIM